MGKWEGREIEKQEMENAKVYKILEICFERNIFGRNAFGNCLGHNEGNLKPSSKLQGI